MEIINYRVDNKEIDSIEIGLYYFERDECYYITAEPLKEINGVIYQVLTDTQYKPYKKAECSSYKKEKELVKKIKEDDYRDILDKILKIYNIKYDELYI